MSAVANTSTGVNAVQGGMTASKMSGGNPYATAAGVVIGGATGAVSGRFMEAGLDQRDFAMGQASEADAADMAELRRRYATFDHWGVEQQQEALARLRAANTGYTGRLQTGEQAMAMRQQQAGRLAQAGAVPQVEGAAGPMAQGNAGPLAGAYRARAQARAGRALAPAQFAAGNAYLDAYDAQGRRDYDLAMQGHKAAMGLDDSRNMLESANINAWGRNAVTGSRERWGKAQQAGAENIARANMIQGAFQSLTSMGGSAGGPSK